MPGHPEGHAFLSVKGGAKEVEGGPLTGLAALAVVPSHRGPCGARTAT